MWLPGVRNLHSARETWEIRAGLETAIDRLVAGVEAIDTDQEILKVHKVRVVKFKTALLEEALSGEVVALQRFNQVTDKLKGEKLVHHVNTMQIFNTGSPLPKTDETGSEVYA